MTFDDFIAMVEGGLSEKRNVMARFVSLAMTELPVRARRRDAVGHLPIGRVKSSCADFLDEFNRVNPQSGAPDYCSSSWGRRAVVVEVLLLAAHEWGCRKRSRSSSKAEYGSSDGPHAERAT